MTTYPEDLDPELYRHLIESRGGPLTDKMGIEFLELGAQRSVARMPVEGNTQVIGLLHGGAHVVLGESLGSISAAIHAGAGRYVVGIEINASHLRSVRDGHLTATATPLRVGRTVQVWSIALTDDEERPISQARCTLSVLGAPGGAHGAVAGS